MRYKHLRNCQLFERKGDPFLRLDDWFIRVPGRSKARRGSKESLLLVECLEKEAFLVSKKSGCYYRPASVGEVLEVNEEDYTTEDSEHYPPVLFREGQMKITFLGDAQIIKEFDVPTTLRKRFH